MSYRFVGIDHVQLAAPEGCEEKARAFYGYALGMPEIPKPESLISRGGVWFQCGSHQLHIGVQPDFSPAKKAHPAFEVDNIAGLKEKLAEDGVALQEDEALEGATRVFVRDPFGNRIEFLERKVRR
ncbi:glyoxalase [Cohnella sp. CFH 77786]|uniref:VOC family protein n=1 Tax=Cohnella sp. CFH 77786 TaxID=2662265 RepID=UPI001C60D797|nr:VOC family protein [Cohnella sp. CFH 77786]MBW5446750.1 glyoxalase [Cohnella sp. CFH 77786]